MVLDDVHDDVGVAGAVVDLGRRFLADPDVGGSGQLLDPAEGLPAQAVSCQKVSLVILKLGVAI